MEKIIIVKNVLITTGTKKNGEKWHKTSILGTDGRYYVTFNKVPENALLDGAKLKLEIKDSKFTDTYDIEKISTISTPKDAIGIEINPSKTILSTQPVKEADLYARDLFERAVKMVRNAPPEFKDVSQYADLITQLIQVMHAKITSDRIAEQEEKRQQAYKR